MNIVVIWNVSILSAKAFILVWDDPHFSLGERWLASPVHKGTKIAPVDDCRFAEPDFTRNKFDQFHQLTRIGSPLSLAVACWLYSLSLLHHYRLISQRHTTLLERCLSGSNHYRVRPMNEGPSCVHCSSFLELTHMFVMMMLVAGSDISVVSTKIAFSPIVTVAAALTASTERPPVTSPGTRLARSYQRRMG